LDTRNYAFVDGNYVRRAYEDSLRPLFPDISHQHLDLTLLKAALQASKVFYYDAVDDDAPDAESRRDYLDLVSGLDGFHVRQGTLSHVKKRQKQVDVRLAVDALTHAFNKNVWHVTLVAGDLDFKPLVDALVNLGIHVHVHYEARSAAKNLYRAADVAVPIKIRDFFNWSTAEFRDSHSLPVVKDGQILHGSSTILKEGMWQNRTVTLARATESGTRLTDKFALSIPAFKRHRALLVYDSDN
jgi:hypothetical protein